MWQKALKPIVDLSVRRQVHPDVFTYSAIIISVIGAIGLYLAGSNHLWLWLIIPCAFLRLLLNLLDGLVARELQLADAFGEVKNEFGDRIADVAIFFGLGFGGYVDIRLVFLLLTLILCISYLGILGKAVSGERVYSGIFGKGDRMISLAIFTLYPAISGNLASFDWFLALASFAALTTLIQRVRTIHGNAKSI
jgi:phosphatidylglycerophosphate synthase